MTTVQTYRMSPLTAEAYWLLNEADEVAACDWYPCRDDATQRLHSRIHGPEVRGYYCDEHAPQAAARYERAFRHAPRLVALAEEEDEV